MNGGSVISKAKGTETIRVADKHTGTSKTELIVNNGLINGGIYVQGTSNDASEIITVNGGTILAERPIRSTLHTFVQSKWNLSVVITLNGGNITSTNPGAWGSTAIVYNDIIGTTYASGWDLTKSAQWIFSITDNR